MTQIQRVIAITVSAALLLSAFALGKVSNSSDPTAAEKSAALVSSNSPTAVTTAVSAANPDTQAFYLTDFKTGYDEGLQQGKTGQGTSVMNSSRTGFNEGFKEGYGAGTESRLQPQSVQTRTVVQPTYRASRSQVVYQDRPAYRQPSRRSSKMRTALTIAAPAAVGAGIGALAGGKKGAGAGALIGGGGGLLYHLFKNR